MRTDAGNFPAEALSIREILPTVEAPSGSAEQTHGKYAALVGVHVAGGPEHGVFASHALGTKACQQVFGSQIPRGSSDAIEDGEPGSNGRDAGVESHPIHVPVRATVEAINEARLGSQVHFLQKRLANEGANSIRPVLATFSDRMRSLNLKRPNVLKARGRHG
jgi:hypothetical protein